MQSIILVQHSQSEHHINNMSGGWTDSKLTELGKEQALKIGISLQSMVEKNKESVLYSSDLLRASQTADILGEQLNLKVHLDQGLRELNTGIATGQTKEWAKKHRNPMKDNQFTIDYRLFDKGESWREFYNRVSMTMNDILKNDQGKQVIIVTHGGAVGYIVAWWLQFEPEMLHNAYFQSDVGSITRLSENNFNQRVLTVFNDVSHL